MTCPHCKSAFDLVPVSKPEGIAKPEAIEEKPKWKIPRFSAKKLYNPSGLPTLKDWHSSTCLSRRRRSCTCSMYGRKIERARAELLTQKFLRRPEWRGSSVALVAKEDRKALQVTHPSGCTAIIYLTGSAK